MTAWTKTPTRVQAHDRRLAAIHEAGHFVIGRHLGLTELQAWIRPSDSVDHLDKTWVGHCTFRSSELGRLKLKQRMELAVAGAIAERAWRQIFEPDEWMLDLEEAFCEREVMSDADWQLAEHRPGEPTRALIASCVK